MTNHDPTPHPESDPFDDIARSIDIRLSIDEQRNLLDELNSRHEQIRQAGGITAVAIDKLPLDAVGNKPKIQLRRSLERPHGDHDPFIEKAFLRLTWTDQHRTTHNRFVEVGERVGQEIEPDAAFDHDQATLTFNQLDELGALKSEGILPNLQEDFGSIFDPSTAIMALRSPEHPS